MGIFVRIEHIKNRGSHVGLRESDQYLPQYGAVKISVTILTEILTAPYCGKYWSDFFGPIYDPPVFNVFYPDKYSHEFSNFTGIIIQFF